MSEYLNNLIMQFKNANGIKNIDLNSENFQKEFLDWLMERRLIIPNYIDFVNGLTNKDNFGSTSVEIGKGEYDSLVINGDASIITPYTDGITKQKGSLIKADFIVFDNMPLVVNSENEGIEVYSCNEFDRFITQNPYYPRDIENWEQLHNAGGNITIGVYGCINDKDIETKLKTMKELESKLFSGYLSDYCTDKGNYMYVVSSNRKILEKELVLVKEKTKSGEITCTRTKTRIRNR